jgi:GntR family transcriptional regulator, transcriptional repressor for pyruvate dehydrogenase complex
VAIAKAARNSVLALIVETVRPLLRNEIVATLKVDSRPDLHHHCHEKIYMAIESGDAAQAAAAMEQHLRATEEMLSEHLESEDGPVSSGPIVPDH